MNYSEQAQALRDCESPHYNCCQSVLLPFARAAGMKEEDAIKIAAHFGAGMNRGATCGAITGALMALGVMGADKELSKELVRRFQELHQAADCAQLLALAEARGEEKKSNCDRMVQTGVHLVEELLAQP